MARVTINHIERWEWPDGDVGCRLDFITVDEAQQQPQIVPQPQSDEAKVVEQIGNVLQSTFQKMGYRPPPVPFGPKMIFFMRSKEYEAIGKPTINDVFNLSFDFITELNTTTISIKLSVP